MFIKEDINMETKDLILLVVIILAVVLLTICIFVRVYKKYVLTNSEALNKLKELNEKYVFYEIPKLEFINKYDNEIMYNEISVRDYLVYQLQFKAKEVKYSMERTRENQVNFSRYREDISSKCILGINTENVKLRFLFLLFERNLFKKYTLKPQINYSIFVRLILTDINGKFKTTKYKIFSVEEIYDILYKLSKRNGNFYLVPEIWESICRVERGKVSNKMRFSIYKRDNYRCKKCGRRTDDLEIDHIFPIAKGGKSTYDNLQTLCRRCNKIKGANIE